MSLKIYASQEWTLEQLNQIDENIDNLNSLVGDTSVSEQIKNSNAVLYTAQELSEDEQMLARKNLDLYREEDGYNDILTWDGDTANKTIVEITEEERYCKVSDFILTLNNFANGYTLKLFTQDGIETINFTQNDLQEIIPGAYTTFDGLFVIIQESAINIDIEGLVFPETGLYFLHSENLYINEFILPGIFGPAIITVPEKYIPNTYAKIATHYVIAGQKPGTVLGQEATAEGRETTSSAMNSHAEGYNTTASGDCSHAEGSSTTASEVSTHAEGGSTTASGSYSHAEGYSTTAFGQSAHAEGTQTTASGFYSHAEGNHTIAYGINSHVQGKYNIKDTEHKYAHIVGNGTFDSDTSRSNAHTLDWDGNAWFQGDVYVGSTSGKNKDEGSKKLATEEFVSSAISAIDYPVDSVNGKTGTVELAAADVGADVAGAAEDALTDAKLYTDIKVADIVNSAPETLNTLNELATALGNDPNFATTVATQIGTKASSTDLTSHTTNKSNPHAVTAAQLGITSETWTFTLDNGTTVTKKVAILS